jgi:hypothetical protein
MHWHRLCLSALGLGMFACGARVSVGDLGDAAMPDSAVTSSGGTGSPTGTGASGTAGAGGAGGAGASTGSGAGGAGGSPGTGGSIGAGATGGSTTTSGSGGAGASGGSTTTGGSGGNAGGTGGAGGSADAGGAADASVGTPCGITYPESGFYGPNILFPDYTAFELMPKHYTMAAFVPAGAPLRLRITKLNGSWGLFFSDTDWRSMGNADIAQDFVPIDTGAGHVAEANITFMGNGRARMDFFECGSTTPTRSKVYMWGNGEGDASSDRN